MKIRRDDGGGNNHRLRIRAILCLVDLRGGFEREFWRRGCLIFLTADCGRRLRTLLRNRRSQNEGELRRRLLLKDLFLYVRIYTLRGERVYCRTNLL